MSNEYRAAPMQPASSIAEFYLLLFKNGVRAPLRSGHVDIRVPQDLAPHLRTEIQNRRGELESYIRRLKGAGPVPSDFTRFREPIRMLSKMQFDRNCIVPVKFGDLSSPLFFPHALSGNLGPCEQLARLLPPDLAVFGFQPVGLSDAREPLRTIPEMAGYYVSQLKGVVPRGPYLLCGWCLGGYIALEMAQQIRDAGDTVGLLAIIDTPLPVERLDAEQRWLRLFSYAGSPPPRGIAEPGHPFWTLSERERLSFLITLARANRHSWFPKDCSEDMAGRLLSYLDAACEANNGYDVRRYDGAIAFFEAEQSIRNVGKEWKAITDHEVDVIPVPGNHRSILEYENAGVLSERLGKAIQRVRLSHAD